MSCETVRYRPSRIRERERVYFVWKQTTAYMPVFVQVRQWTHCNREPNEQKQFIYPKESVVVIWDAKHK